MRVPRWWFVAWWTIVEAYRRPRAIAWATRYGRARGNARYRDHVRLREARRRYVRGDYMADVTYFRILNEQQRDSAAQRVVVLRGIRNVVPRAITRGPGVSLSQDHQVEGEHE